MAMDESTRVADFVGGVPRQFFEGGIGIDDWEVIFLRSGDQDSFVGCRKSSIIKVEGVIERLQLTDIGRERTRSFGPLFLVLVFWDFFGHLQAGRLVPCYQIKT